MNSHKQGGSEALGQGRDIVTGKTCILASVNTNLGDTAVLLFPVCGWGCAYLGLQVKAIKPHLALLMSNSLKLFIICSPQSTNNNNREQKSNAGKDVRKKEPLHTVGMNVD
jgi:hypothetical protein